MVFYKKPSNFADFQQNSILPFEDEKILDICALNQCLPMVIGNHRLAHALSHLYADARNM